MQFLGFLCPLLFLFIGLGMAGLFSFLAMRARRRAAVLGDTPFSNIDRLKGAPGKVRKIKGRLLAQEDLLRSPLGRRDCIYYQFLVEEQHTRYNNNRHGGPHTYWVSIVDDKQCIAATVEDETGAIEIALEKAEVVVKSAQAKESGLFRDPPERLRRLLLERYGRSTKGLLFNKSMRYSESVLEDGARIIVVGEVANSRRGLIFRKHPEVGLVVSDKSDQQLTSHYKMRAVWLWVAAGFALFASLIGVGISGFIAVSWYHAAR